MKTLNKIPKFNNEKEERLFWENNDSADKINWDNAQVATFSRLKPTTKAISIRLSETMLSQIKVKANQLDVPYQSLIKMWLSEHINPERHI